MPLRSACLIFNPIAGSGDPKQDLLRIQELLEPEIALEILELVEDDDIATLAAKAIASEVDIIIASGGDGTLSAVASALVNVPIPMGVIPRGTANAFASALGIPNNLDKACEAILQGAPKAVDVAECNGQLMILLVGIGFEADTVERTDTEKKNRFGMLAYILSGIQELAHLERFKAEIVTENKIIEVVASAITVANAAPPTSILAQGPAGILADDGLLDITIVAPENVGEAIAASYQLFQSALRGEAAEHPSVGYLRAKEITVTTEPPQTVALDGEIVGETPISIKCLPQALTLIVPFIPEPEPEEKLDSIPNLDVKPR